MGVKFIQIIVDQATYDRLAEEKPKEESWTEFFVRSALSLDDPGSGVHE